MRKTASSARERKTADAGNLNLRREITWDIRDVNNIVARVAKVRFKKDPDPFDSLKVFPPKWMS
jgi:hypothetical protein